MCVTSDDRWLFSGGLGGHLLKWNIGDWGLEVDIGGRYRNVEGGEIVSMGVEKGGDRLFSWSWDGYLKEWSVGDGDLIEDWGRLGQVDGIGEIYLSNCGQFLFTMGFGGCLRKWDVFSKEIVNDYGVVDAGPDAVMKMVYG